MTWWKLVFDTKTSTWQAFGRVVFVQAETETAATTASHAAAEAEYHGATIIPLTMTPSTPEAAAAFAERRRRHEEWITNTQTGKPNSRIAL